MAARAKGDLEEVAGTEGPQRTCAVSRRQKAPEDLIRFVAGPDGLVVPDLGRRLPGRGVWVSANRTAVAAAVRRNVFARSLKQPVKAPADLPDLVERLLVRRLAEAVSLANKAGLLVAGFAKVEALLERGRARVLVHAREAANDGMAKLDRRFRALVGSDEAQAATVRELGGAELSLAMGRPNVVHAAASEGGASQRILTEAARLRRYRADADQD
jgi:predicted RNA-binding protein YlxR (DUF448 family)